MLFAVSFIIIIALIGIAAYALRLFRIERVDEEPPFQPSEDPQADQDEASGELPDLSDRVNLFNYFGGGEKDGEVSGEHGADVGTVDELTGLKTGRAFFLEVQKQLTSARAESSFYCAVYLDFDRFRFVNSLKGFAVGDYILAQVAQEIKGIFPSDALLTRISCDHFAVFFPFAAVEFFDGYAEQIKGMCAKLREDIRANAELRCCLGFAVTASDIDYTAPILLQKANIARHCAKISKADHYETYDDFMITSHFYGESLVNVYHECQYSDEITIYYMPLSDLAVNKICGCETLVRWACEDRTPIRQGARIPSNNAKVIYQACRAISRWRKAGRELTPVFVPLSPLELFITDIDEFLNHCLMEFQIEPPMLIVQIDASTIRMDWSGCSKQIKRLRELKTGICVAGIDAGYRDLEFLAGLQVDYIRLHESVAKNADTQPDQLNVCRKMIAFAKQAGIRIIFEGVDTPQLAEALRDIGAWAAQGKYSGNPALCDDFARSLPDYVERPKNSGGTVILDEQSLNRGDFKI